MPDATGKKANLYATIGPADRPGICLSGHTDVVPIDGQDWSSDPWTITEQDGLLHGRGTCDMKGFVAIALTWVEAFARGDLQDSGPPAAVATTKRSAASACAARSSG